MAGKRGIGTALTATTLFAPPTVHHNCQALKVSNHFTDKRDSASPFLKLPPEIRNRIYRLLFGDNLIQVKPSSRSGTDYADWRDFSFSFYCMTSPHCNLLFDVVGAAHVPNDQNSYGDLANIWKRSGEQGKESWHHGREVELPVQLLRTCRQIHTEAALIPYAENCFVFFEGLSGYVREILFEPRQQQAIRSAAVFGYISDLS